MTKKPIEELVADDIMHRDMVTVGLGDTLRSTLELMTANHVTGLPVMDHRSKCVGLISATDILNYEQEHAEESAAANADIAQHFDPDSQRWESIRVTSFALEEFGDVRVEDVMSRDLVSVERNTPVKEIARTMKNSSIPAAVSV